MAPKLTLGFDITPILYNRGVSRYTTNMVRALGNLTNPPTLQLFGSSFRSHRRLRAMGEALAKEAKTGTQPTVLAFPPAFLKNMWYGVGRLHIESLMPKVDVFHAWEELIPPSYKTPVVATIHDLAIFKFEGLAHPETKEKHTKALKRLQENNSHLIAVSTQTKRDLMELFSYPEDRIHVIPESIPTESIVEKRLILPRVGLEPKGVTRPYILWVGTNEPRKNVDRLIKAHAKFAKEFDLVLVGSGFGKNLNVPGVIRVQGASQIELASLYTHAKALVFPSVYEGFGLPILEAFYYGCPVVTSNIPALQEVADDAAIFVNPTEVESIVEGISRVLANGDTKARAKRMAKRLEAFSWEKSAKATLAVYELARKDGYKG